MHKVNIRNNLNPNNHSNSKHFEHFRRKLCRAEYTNKQRDNIPTDERFEDFTAMPIIALERLNAK